MEQDEQFQNQQGIPDMYDENYPQIDPREHELDSDLDEDYGEQMLSITSGDENQYGNQRKFQIQNVNSWN